MLTIADRETANKPGFRWLPSQMDCTGINTAAIAVLLSLVLAAVDASWVRAVDMPWIMYEDPILKKQSIEVAFPPELVDRWQQALARPEREMRRRAAVAIAEAVPKGVPGLDATIDPLCKLLSEPEQEQIVRLSVARALVALDARQTAPLLIEATRPDDLEMAEVVEPALARWLHSGMHDRWMDRLNGEIGLRRLHVLAIRGLAALAHKEALPRILELALNRHAPVAIRLEAADALGRMQDTGLLEPARKLSADRSGGATADRLVAVRMVAAHRGADAEKLLTEMAGDRQPSVQTIALGHLFRIDPSLIFPIIQETVGSQDANVRRWGAESLIASPSPEMLPILASMLDDRDPEIRRYVCDRLVDLAEKPALRESVVNEGRRILNAESWRGQEQATLLLVSLEDTTIVERLLELLDANRAEPSVAAAWGLCELAVPSTLEPVFRVLERKTAAYLAREPLQPGIADQSALLCQLLGALKYAPAEPVLRKYPPKTSGFDGVSRAAAIWALGHLHAGKPDAELARLLVGRVKDAFNEEAPEDWLVCRMSAISLGRMKAVQVIPELQKAGKAASLSTDLGYACAWAVWQLGGEEIPALPPVAELDNDWFLVPATEDD